MLSLLPALLVIGQSTTSSVAGVSHLKHCKTEDPTACVIYMQVGQPTPFDGMLYTPSAAAQQTAKLEAEVKKHREDVEFVKKEAEVALALERRLHQVDVDSWAKEKEVILKKYDAALEETEPSWYERPMFVAPVSIALTVGAMALSVAAFNALHD